MEKIEIQIQLPVSTSPIFEKVFITDMEGNELWTGDLGTTAKFNLEKETKIKIDSGAFSEAIIIEINPQEGCNYEITLNHDSSKPAHYIIKRM